MAIAAAKPTATPAPKTPAESSKGLGEGLGEGQNEGEGAVATATVVKVSKPRLYKVLLHNDNYTTMEFVVMILMTIFHHNEPTAVSIMMQVHQQGVGIAGLYSFELAEARANKVMRLAKEHEYPLRCSLEPNG